MMSNDELNKAIDELAQQFGLTVVRFEHPDYDLTNISDAAEMLIERISDANVPAGLYKGVQMDPNGPDKEGSWAFTWEEFIPWDDLTPEQREQYS